MLVPIAILALLLLLNGVFAMSELAMMTSRRARLQQSASRGSKGAAAALALSAEPTRFLSTVQVAITLIGILAGAFGEKAISSQIQEQVARVPALEPYSDTIALILVVLVITYFSLVLGELVPKRLALAYPEAIASTIARPLRILSIAAAWPVKVLTVSTESVLSLLRIKPRIGDDVSEEDVRSLVARAASTGVFTKQEHALLNRVFRVGDMKVRDLMVPRSEIIWINETASGDELRVLIGTSPHSHFPVCRDSLDSLVGVVHIKDVIAYGLLSGREFKVAAVVHQPLFVPETMPALKLLDQFKSTRTHIAFVVDEYGGTLGLLTLNDLVGALVGDIGRRGDEPAAQAVRRSDGSWLLDGWLPVREAMTTLGIHPDDGGELSDVSTIAGLVLSKLGHIPRRGESTDWHGWRLEVVDMDGTRIDQVLASRAAAPEPSLAP
jgi:putative hemolysin